MPMESGEQEGGATALLESARLLLIPALKFGALTGTIGHALLLFLFVSL